jgi:hypothetical protein
MGKNWSPPHRSQVSPSHFQGHWAQRLQAKFQPDPEKANLTDHSGWLPRRGHGEQVRKRVLIPPESIFKTHSAKVGALVVSFSLERNRTRPSSSWRAGKTQDQYWYACVAGDRSLKEFWAFKPISLLPATYGPHMMNLTLCMVEVATHKRHRVNFQVT